MHILKANESLTDINRFSLNDLQMDYSTTCIIVKLLISKAYSIKAYLMHGNDDNIYALKLFSCI